ncbi:hypothetical protein SAMN06265348_101186 [Pedobacter westerhofensis]|uniref:RING-type E3 ubiquitin transferase n=1 Tax=Pedobacter westerhofensis TaxID=425512 RepID=A0A521AGM3_9SPHI|nr:hypothetical protein [Pedobacter westerhofensis]SMO33985.1 hypothetical protein SAMN06265348_101186 [Pedobacter westerhofensis]
MKEILYFFSSQEVSIPLLVFMMMFSEGTALFHTLIFDGLYGITVRPKYLFFVINPMIVLLAWFVRPGASLLALTLLFASVFLLGMTGMIFSGFLKGKKDRAERKEFEAKYQTPEKEKIRNIFFLVGICALIGLGFWLNSQGRLSLMLLIVPSLIVLDAIFLPAAKTKFYKLQAVLPTSKMNAVAMGLVEVTGDLIQIEPVISPHFNTPCIGYAIRIEERSKDKDGKITWSRIHSSSKTGTFRIKDETGKVTVNGEGLEYYIDRVDKEIESGDKRYFETYLQEDDYLLLIGKASSLNGETLIEKDVHQGVFGAAFPHEVAIKNKFAPLLKSFLATLFFITLIIIYILIA